MEIVNNEIYHTDHLFGTASNNTHAIRVWSDNSTNSDAEVSTILLIIIGQCVPNDEDDIMDEDVPIIYNRGNNK